MMNHNQPGIIPPNYKGPMIYYPCLPVSGPKSFPCGMCDTVLRRPLIVGDSTFDYRMTSDFHRLSYIADKKVRYQLLR